MDHPMWRAVPNHPKVFWTDPNSSTWLGYGGFGMWTGTGCDDPNHHVAMIHVIEWYSTSPAAPGYSVQCSFAQGCCHVWKLWHLSVNCLAILCYDVILCFLTGFALYIIHFESETQTHHFSCRLVLKLINHPRVFSPCACVRVCLCVSKLVTPTV